MSSQQMLPPNHSLPQKSKESIYSKIKPQISYNELKHMVAQKKKIPQNKIALFLKGEILSQNKKIILDQKNIIHCINLENINKEIINIHIKKHNGQNLTKHFKVQSKCNIKQFIDKQLYQIFHRHSGQMFLVYTGKQLDISKNFKQEFIEDDSEIICVDFDESECIHHHPLKNQFHKKIDKEFNPEIELGPSKNSIKPNLTNPDTNAAPPQKPPYLYKKENNPKEIHGEKKEQSEQLPKSQPKQQQQQNPHKLSSGNNSVYNNQLISNIEQKRKDANQESLVPSYNLDFKPQLVIDRSNLEIVSDQVKANQLKTDQDHKNIEKTAISSFQICPQNDQQAILEGKREKLIEQRRKNKKNKDQKQNINESCEVNYKSTKHSEQQDKSQQNYKKESLLVYTQIDQNVTQENFPISQESLQFKAGDLIYSADLHQPQTQNFMQNLIRQHYQLLSKSSHFSKQSGNPNSISK